MSSIFFINLLYMDDYNVIKAAKDYATKNFLNPYSEEEYAIREESFIAGFKCACDIDKKKPTVYLSGPMTMDPDHFKEHFAKAEEKLTKLGYDVTNTARVEYEIEPNKEEDMWGPKVWTEYLKRDLELVPKHEYIALLNGWENSMGAYVELAAAERWGLKVMFESDGFRTIHTQWKIKDLRKIEWGLFGRGPDIFEE